MAAIAFIGLGAMGSRMARRLLDAGHELTVWNRTSGKAEPLRAAGARVAATPAEAAGGAELTITMVRDATALEAVTSGPHGLLAGLGSGALLVEMSTVGQPPLKQLAQRLPDGAGLIDAPVLGSVSEAEQGTLRIFVGGEAALAERARPMLEILGDPVHVGDLCSGAAAKLVANSTLFAVLCGLGEAIALGDCLGLERDAIFAVLGSTPLAAQAERRRAAIEAHGYPPRFPLALARKDADLIHEAGVADRSRDLRLAEAARSWLAEADEQGWGALDYSALLARLLGEPRPAA